MRQIPQSEPVAFLIVTGMDDGYSRFKTLILVDRELLILIILHWHLGLVRLRSAVFPGWERFRVFLLEDASAGWKS